MGFVIGVTYGCGKIEDGPLDGLDSIFLCKGGCILDTSLHRFAKQISKSYLVFQTRKHQTDDTDEENEPVSHKRNRWESQLMEDISRQ